ncbi:MAG: cyclin-dependent kinase 10-like [Lasallia pustulata]|uniref:cyclin-dependent kinase n=1 Tax=Lasallia pustulata TaxID=136370 RepID=A0A5M8PSH5_9LECA|nr:MAG: cyclin-dependent kinase 10-like [Lasallia pustulata]
MNPQWTSVAGQALSLGLESGFLGSCAPISSYEKLNQLGEGAYGVVYRARDRETSKVVALKQVRMSPEEAQNGVPITALREIAILRSLRHHNIVNVLHVAVEETAMDDMYMVMEYAEQDLANLLDELRVKFSLSQVKCLFRQLLEGIDHLHKNDIIHRDVKMQNILLTAKGVLKLADFGMARPYTPRPLTPGVVTIWYRAPELLLGTKYYTPSVDLWSAGLILAELLLSAPCLPGETPIEQLALTVKLLGSPTPDDTAALSAMGCPELIKWRRESLASGRADNLERRFLGQTSTETVNFLRGLLKWDPRARWTAAEALGKGRSRFSAEAERWWKESPRAVEKELLPTYPEVRNGVTVGMACRGKDEEGGGGGTSRKEGPAAAPAATAGYVFDFGEQGALRRPAKRHRAR